MTIVQRPEEAINELLKGSKLARPLMVDINSSFDDIDTEHLIQEETAPAVADQDSAGKVLDSEPKRQITFNPVNTPISRVTDCMLPVVGGGWRYNARDEYATDGSLLNEEEIRAIYNWSDSDYHSVDTDFYKLPDILSPIKNLP